MPRQKDGRQSWRLYNDLSWTWPIISNPKDYVAETQTFMRLMRKYSLIPINSLLNLGCGGGHNDYTFKRAFQTTGIDTSEKMIQLAKQLNPEVTYRTGDMRSIRLRKKYDTVAILDAISYMQTRKEMEAAFRTAHFHLKRGGVFLTFVEETPSDFCQNRTDVNTFENDNVSITFIENYYMPDPYAESYESTYVYFIRKDGKQDVQIDRHKCGLFELPVWIEMLEKAGFRIAKQVPVIHPGDKDKQRYRILVCIKD